MDFESLPREEPGRPLSHVSPQFREKLWRAIEEDERRRRRTRLTLGSTLAVCVIAGITSAGWYMRINAPLPQPPVKQQPAVPVQSVAAKPVIIDAPATKATPANAPAVTETVQYASTKHTSTKHATPKQPDLAMQAKGDPKPQKVLPDGVFTLDEKWLAQCQSGVRFARQGDDPAKSRPCPDPNAPVKRAKGAGPKP